ncbi:MAG TPA: DUF1566 domain-containing protein [Myxococcota bacterium]|nr:DUF1566 domain-containing protein [Myxococcota bacterium]
MTGRFHIALLAGLICACGPTHPPFDSGGTSVLDAMPGDSSGDGHGRGDVFLDVASPDSDVGSALDVNPSDMRHSDPGKEVPGDQGGDSDSFETLDPVCPRSELECRIGVYNSQIGTCGEQTAPDGTPCETGACQEGSCVEMCWNDDCPTWLVDENCRCNVLPTGSDFCIDDKGVVACDAIPPGHSWWGQDAQTANGDHTFEDNGNGTATDTLTGLVWAIQPSGPLGLSAAENWCSELISLPGQGWRVPNILELFTLVDAGEPDCMWDPVFGTGCGENQMYWSSSQAYMTANFCTVHRRGNIEACEKVLFLPVRCVRGGKPVGHLPDDRFVQFEEMIHDRLTGISWARDIDAETATFGDAMRTCARKGQGWRLPTTAELASIMEPDYPTDGCAKWNDKLGKYCDEQLYFWTSTPNPVPTEPRSAFAVHMFSGHIHENALGQYFRYRCVKTWNADDEGHEPD